MTAFARFRSARLGAALALVCAFAQPAAAESTLRIAMTASDIPTATGMPNNGFEGMRFLGYPIFEGLVLWDLTRTDKLADLRPGLAEKWEQAADDEKTWIFHLRHDAKFHDGTDFNADAVIWNLERYFNKTSPQFEVQASGIAGARVPLMASYRKVDDYTVAITSKTPASFFPYMMVYILFTSPASFDKAGKDWAKVAMLPAAGTGPFKITKVTPRQSVDLARVGRLLGQGQAGQGRSRGAAAGAGGQRPPRRAALGPGRLDRGPAVRRHSLAQGGRLRHHHRLLPARVAVVLQHRRQQQPVQGRAGAPGAELLRRSRQPRGPARRHGGARRRLAQGQGSQLRFAGQPLLASIPPRARRCSRRRATDRRSR